MKNFLCFYGVMIALFNFVVFVNFHLVLHVTYVFFKCSLYFFD